MRTNKKLAVEKLERREVFSVATGFEGFAPDAEPNQVTDQEIIDALNAGTQLTAEHQRLDAAGNRDSGMSIFDFATFANNPMIDGSDVGLQVNSPRDVASGLPTGKSISIEVDCNLRNERLDAASVDDIFCI